MKTKRNIANLKPLFEDKHFFEDEPEKIEYLDAASCKN